MVVYDDDHNYLGGVIAEKLRGDGHHVTLVTTESIVSAWTVNTLEQHFIQTRLLEKGIELVLSHRLAALGNGVVTLACDYSGREKQLPAASVVMITSRLPVDNLYWELVGAPEALDAAGIKAVKRIGDCYGPSTIAAAVYEGHRYARELGEEPVSEIGFARELTELTADWQT